jgi:hypothetical protein
MNPLRQFSLRVFLAIPLSILCWWLLVSSFLNLIIIPVNSVISEVFSREQIQLNLQENGDWHIDSMIMFNDKIDVNGDFEVWSRKILKSKILTHTLGFALLWAFLIAVPENIFTKIKKILFATILLIFIVYLAITFNLFHVCIKFIAEHENAKIFILTNTYQYVKIYPPIIISAISIFKLFFAYLAIVIMPIFIAYNLNKKFVRIIFYIHSLI